MSVISQADTPVGTAKNPRRVELVRVQNAAVPLRPLLLNETDAAGYIGRAPATLRNMRSGDAKRIAQGLLPEGPTWIKLGRQPMYPLDDRHGDPGLERWVRENGEKFGMNDAPLKNPKPGTEA